MKNQFYQGIVKFTINYSLKILSFFNFGSIKTGVKMKPMQVKPEKQGQAQGNPPDLKFSLIIGHDYNVSEYPSDQHITLHHWHFFHPQVDKL